MGLEAHARALAAHERLARRVRRPLAPGSRRGCPGGPLLPAQPHLDGRQASERPRAPRIHFTRAAGCRWHRPSSWSWPHGAPRTPGPEPARGWRFSRRALRLHLTADFSRMAPTGFLLRSHRGEAALDLADQLRPGEVGSSLAPQGRSVSGLCSAAAPLGLRSLTSRSRGGVSASALLCPVAPARC